MRIGIDIDDTLTNINEELVMAAFNYAKCLGKNINEIQRKLENATTFNNLYQDIFEFTYEEKKYFLKYIQEKITEKAKPRKYVVKVLKKLKKRGHEIIIITARDKEFHDDPYLQSKEWLDKNSIVYDKIIVNARKKEEDCQKEKIDLYIDDNLGNCLKVCGLGIDVIKIGTVSNNNDNIICLNNWKEIYKYFKAKYER